MGSKNDLKHRIMRAALFLLNVVAAFALGWMAHDFFKPAELKLPILAHTFELLHEYGFNDPPTDPALEYGMIHGMTGAYGDPYTRFVEPPQHELETNQLEGKYGGIGATLKTDEEGYIILYPFPDSPAAQAGIQDGDRLIGVDDIEITPQTPLDETIALIRGPEGKKVKIIVARPPDEKVLEFTIKRADIPIPSVTWYLAPEEERVGVIQINLISATTPDEIKTAVDALKNDGAQLFVLDLRNNGGGYLNEGLEISRLFLKEGIIIEEFYKTGNTKTYKVNLPGALADLPLVVLVNGNTASAAELISGALQANQRALLIGAVTFGKNSVQTSFTLEDGSSFHITSAKWRIPGIDFPTESGGLIPDIIVPEDAEGSDPALSVAIETLLK